MSVKGKGEHQGSGLVNASYAPINVKPEGGGGGGGHRVGILTFSKKVIKFPTPGQKIIVKISRSKWFSSHLLFEIDRSSA